MDIFNSETAYNIGWAPTIMGSATLSSAEETILISQKLLNSSNERMAASLAHEFKHAEES